MKSNKPAILRGSVVVCLAVVIPGLAAAKTLIVGNNRAECPQAQYGTIQSAINAAGPKDEIHICNGIYPEQISIDKALDIDADTGAFLTPAAMTQNSTSLATADAIAAAVLIVNATNVSISGLTVDGVNNGIEACGPRLIGVYFQNSSGNLEHAAVRNFMLGSAYNGCQSGDGVFVESGGGKSSNVEIANCSIHDFQKNGITANGAGTTVQIHDNVVTGLGPTTGAAQNGIQIGFSAAGTVRENVVANTVWSPCTVAASCAAVATSILVTQADGVKVLANTVGVSQVGIFIDANSAEVNGNTVYASSVFEGIRIGGNSSDVSGNRVVNGGEACIFVGGNDNSVKGNTVQEAPVGILSGAGASGNTIAGNTFFNVAAKTQTQ